MLRSFGECFTSLMTVLLSLRTMNEEQPRGTLIFFSESWRGEAKHLRISGRTLFLYSEFNNDTMFDGIYFSLVVLY